MKRKTSEEFIEKSIKIHGNKYNYTKVEYKNNYTKVNIICPEHGQFKQVPYSHLKGEGCFLCGIKKRKKSKSNFINECNKIHKNKYNYSKIKYKNAHTKICIICPEHGEFWQEPSSHSKGIGCPKCSKTHSYTNNEFIELSNGIHNNTYNYSKTDYKNAHSKIIIICNKHGEFEQTASSHIKGSGCPICKSSKGELEIMKFLKMNDIKFIHQYTFNGCKNIKALPFDFYLPKYNICIEYDGIQHFEPRDYFGGIPEFKNRKENDRKKYEFCMCNNIDLLRIPYYCNAEKMIKLTLERLNAQACVNKN